MRCAGQDVMLPTPPQKELMESELMESPVASPMDIPPLPLRRTTETTRIAPGQRSGAEAIPIRHESRASGLA